MALDQGAGLVGLRLQALAVPDDGGLRGEGGQHAAVLGRQHATGQGERRAVVDRHVHVGVLGPFDQRARAHAGHAGPRFDVAPPLQQDHGLHGERLAQPLQQRGQAVLAPRHAARQEGEDLGLGAQPGRLVGASGREVDHRGHGHRHPHEDDEGEDVLDAVDGPQVLRWREVVVEEQRAEQRRREGRQQSAEQGRGHGGREEEQHVVAEA